MHSVLISSFDVGTAGQLTCGSRLIQYGNGWTKYSHAKAQPKWNGPQFHNFSNTLLLLLFVGHMRSGLFIFDINYCLLLLPISRGLVSHEKIDESAIACMAHGTIRNAYNFRSLDAVIMRSVECSFLYL